MFTALRPSVCASQSLLRYSLRWLGASAAAAAKQMPPRPTVNEADIEEAFLKGSGPGGQKINKTSSAVQLKHLPTGMVIKCQATRSRTQNRKIARQLIAEKLEVLEKGSESRVAVKAEVKRKKKASRAKKAMRKYRALEEGKTAAATGSVVDGGLGEGEGEGGEDDEEWGEEEEELALIRPAGKPEDERDVHQSPPDPPRI